MVKPAATCEVWVNGARFADGAADYLAGVPSALEGLRLVWGRGTTVDQPETSTVSLPMADLAGAASFLDLVPVGADIELWAAGRIPSAGGNVAADPEFETLAPAARVYTPAGLALSQLAAGPVSGKGIRIRNTGTAAAAAVIAPDVFSNSVTAWDHIPTRNPGVAWPWALTVRAGVGVAVTVTPVLLASPAVAGAGSGHPVGAPVNVTGDGAAHPVSGTTYGGTDQSRGWLALQVNVGPGTTWNATAGTWNAQAGSWDDRSSVDCDALRLTAPTNPLRRVMVWAGKVSDIVAGPDIATGGTALEAAGVDASADLANRYIGDEPWAAETIAARATRILALSGSALTITVAAALGPLVVSRRDVDRQSAFGLLTELAESADGVLWPATHAQTGAYLWLEDPGARVPARELTLSGGVVVIVGGTTDVTRLSSADLLADPTRFTQDVSDVVTRVDVTWQEQTVPDPTEHTVTVIDNTAETDVGAHRLGRSTQLTTAPDATNVANRILARSRGVPWRVTNLTWHTDIGLDVLPGHTDGDRATALLDLLDGTRRAGRPILLTELPEWTPTAGADLALYLEGGSYTFEHGAWHLDLVVTPSQAIGQSVQWNQLDPAWTWNMLHPSITWQDLIGTGP